MESRRRIKVILRVAGGMYSTTQVKCETKEQAASGGKLKKKKKSIPFGYEPHWLSAADTAATNTQKPTTLNYVILSAATQNLVHC